MTLIVLISGYISSGKDAAAEILCDDMMFQRMAFADALKEDVAEKTGLSLDAFYNRRTKDERLPHKCAMYPTAKTYRDVLLQHALRQRASNPDIFAQIIADAIMEATPRIVISDWRFRNEYEHLRRTLDQNQYQIVRCRIERPGIVPTADPSEHELDDEPMDFTVQNDGTITELGEKLKKHLRPLLSINEGLEF